MGGKLLSLMLPPYTPKVLAHFKHNGCSEFGASTLPEKPNRHPQAVTNAVASCSGGAAATIRRLPCPFHLLLTSSLSKLGGRGCSDSPAVPSELADEEPDDEDDSTSLGGACTRVLRSRAGH